ncbi:hypothetical protein TEA_010421 [Camellia sinensis var. sinensis]|uniref:Alpha/beta hydrolase fold-3 domain-containing protein n=1 Tax=Camellia sinensis var. sinensis TaxID=542762 RepID=A0A4S4EFX8_CAMSN|nr:hypothetical protein TEA_010421 [Camellia sinensis var. sinensis]
MSQRGRPTDFGTVGLLCYFALDEEIVQEFPNFIRVYRDGRVERLAGTDTVPPSTNPETGVQSKDVVIDPETSLSARLYIPKTPNPHRKLPLLVYFYGGAFCVETAFSPSYHNYLNSLTSKANVVVVSVDYRRAPEHPLPIPYNDSWAAVKWVASHSTANGGIRVGLERLDGVKLVGIVLIHPYFGGKDPIGCEGSNMVGKAVCDKLWGLSSPESEDGCDDPFFNPGKNPKLSRMGCRKVLVCVGEKDVLRDRGWCYKEELGKSGWGGVVEVMEAVGENHVFHLVDPTCDNAVAMLDRVASFLNEEDNA